ncbi:MAG TPA: hypothetical protein VMZ29_17155 [Candidatus Bathyarchaeia archaeon]|nr:hypothetical protein [Candidatus Bathyarchaeia archaeon]
MTLISQKNRFGNTSNLFSKLFLVVFLTIVIFIIPIITTQSIEVAKQPTIYNNESLACIPPFDSDIITEIPTFDPYIFTLGDVDSDFDGLTDAEEIIYKTNPFSSDTDFDGLLDGAEVHIYLTIPIFPDSDRDYIADSWELFLYKTDPLVTDMDKDGLNDGLEIFRYKSDPLCPDTDNDLLNDNDEARIYFTDVLNQDSDQDGIMDGEEVHIYKTNPLSVDTDGDTLNDLWEINNNHNPLRKDDWDRIIGTYILIPGVTVILVLIGIFASIDLKLIHPIKFRTPIRKITGMKLKQIQLMNLLSNIPDNQSYNIKELALLTGESVSTINRLISSIFDNTDPNEKLQFKSEDISIHSHTGKTYFEYHCFYCDNPIDYTLAYCPFCDEDIVRCRECKRPINNNDSYATFASYETIGEPNNVSGYIVIELICESCLLQSRYDLI